MRFNKRYGVFQRHQHKNTLVSTHSSPDAAARELFELIDDHMAASQAHQKPAADSPDLSEQVKQLFYVKRVK